jgi:hypothetical protein
MLISVHLPKAGGSSVRKSLADHFGERLTIVYDAPINTPAPRRNVLALGSSLRNGVRDFGAIECIHGHFLPLKYLALKLTRNARFVTWLRHPTERVISHYYYFQRAYHADVRSKLWRRTVEEGWSLERFCLCPELRNFYCQFLWGFPLRAFDFIGFVEHFEEDFRHFSERFLGAPRPLYRENSNDERKDRGYEIDPELRRRIERYHAKDLALYQRALSRRSVPIRADGSESSPRQAADDLKPNVRANVPGRPA